MMYAAFEKPDRSTPVAASHPPVLAAGSEVHLDQAGDATRPWSALPDIDPSGQPFDPEPDPPPTDPLDPLSSGNNYPVPSGEPEPPDLDPSELEPQEGCGSSGAACWSALPLLPLPPAPFRSFRDSPNEELLLA